MKKYSRIIVFFIITILALTACSPSVDEGEIKDALGELIPKSEELNVIYFGEGLPLASDRELVEAFYNTFDSDVEMINYHPVSPDCGYTSEDDIRAATLEVFTEDYAEFLFDRAFVGISTTISEGTDSAVTQSAVYAMYLMQNGTLTVRLNLASDSIPLGRTYDIDTARIIKVRNNYVIVSVLSELDGEKEEIELRVVMTENGWRLDSPTY